MFLEAFALWGGSPRRGGRGSDRAGMGAAERGWGGRAVMGWERQSGMGRVSRAPYSNAHRSVRTGYSVDSWLIHFYIVFAIVFVIFHLVNSIFLYNFAAENFPPRAGDMRLINDETTYRKRNPTTPITGLQG